MIKHILLIVSIFTLMISAIKEKKIDYIIFSGKIENPNSDTLSIRNRNGTTLYYIKLSENKIFRDTLMLPEGYYFVRNGRKQTEVYFNPGFVLNLALNTKKFDESIIYTGRGSSENNYLAKKALLEDSFRNFNYHGYYGKLNEKDFLKLTDSLYNIKVNFFNEYKNSVGENFALIESKSLEFEMLNRLSEYEATNRFVTGNKDFKVSTKYPDPFAKINLSNDELLMAPDYLRFVESYLYKLSKDELKGNDSLDLYLCYVENLEKQISNPLIREALSYSIGKYRLGYTKKLDKVYEKLNSFILNREYSNEVKENYQKLKKIEKGAISPTFKLEDINGQLVSLESLKGKLVYIDIWAL